MFRKKIYRLVIVSILTWISIGFVASIGEATSCKVLVVMSYEEDNPWCVEIKEGIDSVLASTCEVKYFVAVNNSVLSRWSKVFVSISCLLG